MSLRPATPADDAGRVSRLYWLGGKHEAAISVTYARTTTARATVVTARARGDEIAETIKEALQAAKSNVVGKPIGRNRDSISVRSLDKELPFSIMIQIEHGGDKVTMSGNVGGEYKEHRLTSDQRISDDWIASATAGFFMVAGGKADDTVQIEYYENRQ